MSKSKRKLAHCRYLGGKCVVSGSKIEDDLAQWGSLRHYSNHHINPARKADNYDNLIRRETCSLDALEELDKCVLVKSDYHDIIEDQKIKGTIRLPDGRELPVHSGIFDRKRKFGWDGMFFLDHVDLKRIIPRQFTVIKGKFEMVMDENQFCSQFIEYLISLSPGEHLQVRKGELVLLDIEKLDKENVDWKMDGRFDLFPVMLKSKDNIHHVRNGRVIDKRWNDIGDNGNFSLSMKMRLTCSSDPSAKY